MMRRFSSKPHGLIAISGMLWFAVAVFLLGKGLFQLVSLIFSLENASGICHRLVASLGSIQKVILLYVGAALFVGLLKAKMVLSKVVEVTVHTVMSQSDSLSLKTIFTPRYLRLIMSMMCLGMALNWIGLSTDIRAFICVTIGSALMNGSFIYFRVSTELAKRYQ